VLQAAALILLVVFGFKAALAPLSMWLPATYAAASPPVAALFAIMTKVGIYAILRVTTLIFGDSGGPASQVAAPALEVLALATLVLGAVGALAAQHLRTLVGYVVVASAGTLLLSIALARIDTVAAGLFYLVNSTLTAAGLFLIADRVRAARAATPASASDAAGDALVPLSIGPRRMLWGGVFFVFAIAAAGLPPLAGFLGKALLLQAAGLTTHAAWIVGLVLACSLIMVVAFVRSGSSLFWKSALDTGISKLTQSSNPDPDAALPTRWMHGASLLCLGVLIVACALFAGPLSRYTHDTADQLFERNSYIDAVLRTAPVPPAMDVRREMREREKPKSEEAP
jgi:multicomponent K+:H+ antiporter subunit D